MKNKGKLFGYGFGLVMGLMGLAHGAEAQTVKKPAKEKNMEKHVQPKFVSGGVQPLKVEEDAAGAKDGGKQKLPEKWPLLLEADFLELMVNTFVQDTATQGWDIEQIVEAADSAKKYNLQNVTPLITMKIRISDNEQIALVAQDRNNDRLIEEKEVDYLMDYVADKEKVTCLIVRKREESEMLPGHQPFRYAVTRMLSPIKDTTFPFEMDDYDSMKDWAIDFKDQPKLDNRLLGTFKYKNHGARGPKIED